MTFEKHEAKALEGTNTRFNGGDVLSQANISDLPRSMTNAAGLPSMQITDSNGGAPRQVAEFFMNVGQSWGQAGTPNGLLATGPVLNGKWTPVRVYRPDGSVVAPLALPAPPKA
jgi:hypothetical protein